MKEREISLIDLMVEILLKWRVIIVWMLVGGILMGGLSYVRSYRAAQAEELQQEAENDVSHKLEELMEQLTETQYNNINMVLNYESFYEAESKYFQESARMKMNPLEIPKVEMTFQVVAEDIETARRIEQVYEDMVSGGLIQWLAEGSQDGMSDSALSELIGLSRSSRGLLEGGDTFCVRLCHISKEQCLQLAEKVDEYFQEQCSRLTRTMGDHQIQLVNQSFTFVMDEELLSSQRAKEIDIMNWNDKIVKLKDAFSEEEWQYYNYLTTGKIQEAPVGYQELAAIKVIEPSVSVKYILLGMILFAFTYVFYVFIQYILSAKLRIADDINTLYGVPELGVIPVEKSGKKPLAFVDGWILRLRDWNKRKFSVEEAMGLAAVAVKMAAKKEELNEICCIGCNLKANAVGTADAIQKVLEDANISMKVLNNVLYDQEAMEQLLSARGAFLLERAGETLYDEISREIELLHRQEIKVLGVIVVE